MNDFAALDAELEQLLANVAPEKRRAVAGRIGRALRASQAARIAAQQNPDGSGFTPRKPRTTRTRTGEIKRKSRARAMFAKLRRARYLRAQSSADEAKVGFLNATVARVARVHQQGLRDRVSRRPGAPEVTYAERQLLGFSGEDRAMILDMIAQHMAQGL